MDKLSTKISNVVGITDCEDFLGMDVFQQHHIFKYLWKAWQIGGISMIVIEFTNIFPTVIRDKLFPVAEGVFKFPVIILFIFTNLKLLSAIGHFINYDKEMAAEREYNRKHGLYSCVHERGYYKHNE